MPISTLTAITPIPEGSEATPGLFNSRFSQIQQNVQELNQQAIGLLSGFVTGGAGAPESVITGTPGFLYVQLDAAAEQHPHWVKFTGSGSTGWRGFEGFQGTGLDSYQVGRGAAAAGENASAFGRSARAAGSASQAWGYQAAANQPSATAFGANSRASGANAIAGGLNAYAGQLNAGALGSAVTSNATGAWGFGTGAMLSHQSAVVFTATEWSSQNTHEFYVNYPLSTFSTRVVVNMGGSDGEVLTVKSSDIAHGMTGRTDTDTYGEIQKSSNVSGGLKLGGHSMANNAIGIEMSCEAGAGDTTKSTAARAALYVNGLKANGVTVQSLGANENIAAFANGSTVRFILDGDGDSHQDVGTAWTNFDTHDDIALLNQLSAHVTRKDDPLRENFAGWLSSSRSELEALRLVSFDKDARPFLNLSRLAMLHTGALRQLGQKIAAMEAQLGLRALPPAIE